MVILESAGATLLIFGSVLILRAWWRVDQPPATPAHARRRRLGSTVTGRHIAAHKRAA